MQQAEANLDKPMEIPTDMMTVEKAYDAVKRSFPGLKQLCWDSQSKDYFVEFKTDSGTLNQSEKEFPYRKGWSTIDGYDFILLSNGTAALRALEKFKPIDIDPKDLTCIGETQ